MKRVVLMFSALALLAVGALAAEFQGYVVDDKCAARQGAKAASEKHADCAASCIKAGAKAVLVTSEGQVYKLDDQAKAAPHAGKKVTVSGDLEGETIKVSDIKS